MHIFVKTSLTAVLGIVFATVPMSAATIFSTTLSGANEVPPTGSAGTGTALVTLAADTLSVSITFSGLGSPDGAAHIHCCGPVGVNEPIAVPFTGFPTGVTSGSFNGSFDLTSLGSYSAAFLLANGNTAASAEAALIAGLNAGQAYANIHTTNFGGGEIRGQLAAVPEPATAFLAGGVLAALALLRRKRA
jgi:hypothetical protein